MNLKLRNFVKDGCQEMMKYIMENDVQENEMGIQDIIKKYTLLLSVEQIKDVCEFFHLDKEYFAKHDVVKNQATMQDFIVLSPFDDLVEMGYFDMLDGVYIEFVPHKYVSKMHSDIKYDFLEKWEHGKDLKRVVITHKNCNDGAGVVAVVKHHRDFLLKENGVEDEIEFLFLDYNSYNISEVEDIVRGKLVYVGDFSFKPFEYNQLILASESIVTVDHHKAAMDEPDIVSNISVHLDMTKSGCQLAYEFFMTKLASKFAIIEFIGDRDLWNFFFDVETKATALIIKKEGHDFITNMLSTTPEESNIKLMEYIEEYRDEVIKQEQKYVDKANECEQYRIAGINFVGLNLTVGPNEILNHASRLNNVPAFSYYFKDNLLKLSFRNFKDDIDVDKLAYIYGGGGHAQSSGSTINVSNIIFEDLFLNHELVVKYEVTDEATLDLFDHYGARKDWVKNSKHVAVVMEGEKLDFHSLFKVTRDAKNNLVLTLKYK